MRANYWPAHYFYSMKINDIAAHLGTTKAALADLMGVTKQGLNSYMNGSRNAASKFIIQLCAVAGLNQEEILFPDVFDSVEHEHDGHPAYWISLAIEALKQAEQRGANVEAEMKRLHRKGRALIGDEQTDSSDLSEIVINAFGNQHFNSGEVLDALKGKEGGSITAIANALPDIERLAKELY